MKRSFPLAQCWLRPVWSPRRPIFGSPSLGLVCRGQFSAWQRSGSRAFPDRQTTPVTRHSTRRPVAFTLIELLVVMAVVAILAGLTLGGLGFVNRKGAASRAQTEVAALSAAIESYKLDYGNYPAPDNLYAELTAQKGAINTNKVYFEPVSGMVRTNVTPRVFQDPYGQTYNYNPTDPVRNIGFFDLWCVPPPPEGNPSDPKTWIHN